MLIPQVLKTKPTTFHNSRWKRCCFLNSNLDFYIFLNCFMFFYIHQVLKTKQTTTAHIPLFARKVGAVTTTTENARENTSGVFVFTASVICLGFIRDRNYLRTSFIWRLSIWRMIVWKRDIGIGLCWRIGLSLIRVYIRSCRLWNMAGKMGCDYYLTI